MLRNLLLPFMLAALIGCSSTANEEDETAGMTAAEMYDEARYKLDDGEYESAIRTLEILESRYPYGIYAEQAQMEIAFAYYKYNEPESAILAAERFIKLHPNHKSVDYAYFIRALASYEDEMGFVYRIFNQNPVSRDPKSARRAFNFFSELVQRFPESKYTPEAIQRMYVIRDNLAAYEIHVINYYQRRKAFVAVVNRAKYVVENYQNTPAVPDALAAMVYGYRQLGLEDLAEDAFKVLKLNYPKHDATQRTAELFQAG